MLCSEVEFLIIWLTELGAPYSNLLNFRKDKFFTIIIRDIFQTGTDLIRQLAKLSLDLIFVILVILRLVVPDLNIIE